MTILRTAAVLFLGAVMTGFSTQASPSDQIDRDVLIARETAWRACVQGKGGRLITLTFPETRAQRFGDTVVLYGRYEARLTAWPDCSRRN